MKAVIIGANRGIGLGLVRKYLQQNWEVWAVSRSLSTELEESTESRLHVISGIDVSIEADRTSLVEQLPNEIDQLIHNAGILRRDSLAHLDESSILEQLIINAVSPLQTIQKLSPLVRTGGKIGIMSSRMGSIADNTSGSMYGYRMSKAAVNMAGMGLAQDLRSDGIAVFLLHPGYVQTDMTGGRGYITVQQSVEGLYQRMQELQFEQTGSFWHTDGTKLTW